jgi:hypothetical protein
MKEVFSVILLMLVGMFFLGVGVGIFLWVLRPPMEAKKILKNGIETTATIVGIGSNVKISNSQNGKKEEQYYFLKLSFVNSSGKTITFKTKSIYPESFIEDMNIVDYNINSKKYDITTKESIQVISLGNKAVVKDFIPNNRSSWWLWILSFVFSLVGTGILISLAIGVINVTVESIIKLHGAPTAAVYSSHTYDTVSSTETLYTIYFSFENTKGETVVGKKLISNSDIEAEMLIELGLFPIKYIGNKAAVMLNKDEILHHYEQ